MILKTPEEIERIRESALIVSQTLGMLASDIKPGVTTIALDRMAEPLLLHFLFHGDIPRSHL